MTPEYIASKLSLLPQFEVTSLDHRTGERGRVTLLKGFFSTHIDFEEQGAFLYLPDVRFLDGQLLAAADDEERTIEVNPYSWSEISERDIAGTSLAFFSNYDPRRLNLALNPDIVWREVDFQPRKAIQSYIIGTDGMSYRRLREYKEGTQLEAGETIVEDTWDHEHCIFCWNKIDSENIGYTSQHKDWGDEWACKWCYEQAVNPHDPRPLLLAYAART